jgi:hypothetical protein
MSKQTYNAEDLTRYLLGSLEEAESERLDELSLTDDEFAVALRSTENDLVDAYAQDELTGATLAQFKSHYLASPLRRERARFAQAFQNFAEREAGAHASDVRVNAATGVDPKRKGLGWFSALSVFNPRRSRWQWGFAVASIVLIVAGGWLAFENLRLRQQLAQTQASARREQELRKELEGQRTAGDATAQELAQARAEGERLAQELRQQAQEEQRRLDEQRADARQPTPSRSIVASLILAPQVRGTSQFATVSVPSAVGFVAVRLQLEPNDDKAYRVALLDESHKRTLWQSNRLTARASGDSQTLDIRLPAGLLKPRAYVLRVTGVAANGASEIISEYPFKVVE